MAQASNFGLVTSPLESSRTNMWHCNAYPTDTLSNAQCNVHRRLGNPPHPLILRIINQ